MKSLSLLGSTGSIGTQTLDIVRRCPNEFKIAALTTNTQIDLIKKQIEEFNPIAVCVMDENKAEELERAIDIEVYSGIKGLIKIAALNEPDTVVNSLVGSIGVLPTVEAIRKKKNIALANKETLVAAGSIVMKEAEKHNVRIMPIDSEHSAIFQCLNGERLAEVNRIIITCSGGAFKNLSKKEFENVKPSDALRHPTWKMGAKITIDSATLMNKGFEVIEAHWLYHIPYEKIEVVIHPQSTIHSLVEFCDNSVIAQLGLPDMRIPIQYALSYPKRMHSTAGKLDLAKARELTFREPDFDMFPCLKYAYYAGKIGGTIPAVMNAANEVAVKHFLKDSIRFNDIPRLIKKMMDSHKLIKNPSIDEVMEADRQTKEKTEKDIG